MVDGAVGTGGAPESSDSLRTFGAVVQALREHKGLSRDIQDSVSLLQRMQGDV